MRERQITVAAMGYFQPILDLCERLTLRPPTTVAASRVTHFENGYSLSIVLLSVVMLEALIGRVSDLQTRLGAKGKANTSRLSVPDYIAGLRRSFKLKKSLTEVFVLRDAIAHGHVWSLEVSGHAKHGSVLHSAKLGAAYGDKKFCDRVNLRTRRTRALGLHVVPSAVSRKEVIKVLDVIRRTLMFLEHNKLIESNVTRYHGRLRGKPFEFWDIIDVLIDSSQQCPRLG